MAYKDPSENTWPWEALQMITHLGIGLRRSVVRPGYHHHYHTRNAVPLEALNRLYSQRRVVREGLKINIKSPSFPHVLISQFLKSAG